MALVYVGLGTNLGNRMENINNARKEMKNLPETILLQNAPLYETHPIGGPKNQKMYYNSVSLLDTNLNPFTLLDQLQSLEAKLGRDRSTEEMRWGPRIIDLDILLWDDKIVENHRLVVPHPRISERAFVLCPLSDLDADLLHPVLEVTVRELLERMDLENEGIRRVLV